MFKMEKRLIIGLTVLFFATSAYAQYFPLDDEDIYCNRYGISNWCNEQGVEHLKVGIGQEELKFYGYINDLAFSDELRYQGDLKIISIDVNASLSNQSVVEAKYVIKNPSRSEITVNVKTLGTPITTQVFDNNYRVDVDSQLEGINLTFGVGEEKELLLKFSEPLYGSIFGYNVNLLFDGRTVDNHITPKGRYIFSFPSDAIVIKCTPGGYIREETDEGIQVSWEKEDFVPWTNPFNDLICSWGLPLILPPREVPSESPGPDTGEVVETGDDSGMILLVGVVAIILAIVFLLQKRINKKDKKANLWFA